MSPLYSIITFNGKKYEALTDENEKRQVEILVEKLQPMEARITNAKEIFISIKTSGTIGIMCEDRTLAAEITELIQQ